MGHDFHAGFSVWSMHALWARDLDPEAGEDDERAVSERVSVAPYTYVTEGWGAAGKWRTCPES